ncbi:MAG: tetratricopeptide repeat protein [bacterium]|nr:tetratricopeptide repeat protein [bacterium]
MRRTLPLCFLIVILAFPALAAETTDPWKESLDAAREAQRRYDWDAVHATYESALKLAQDDPARYETTLEAWAASYKAQTCKVEALRLQQQAVENRLGRPDAVSRKTIVSLFRLGELYQKLGPYERAEETFRRALEMRRALGDDKAHPSEGSILRALNSTLKLLRPDDEEREQLLQANLETDPTAFNRRLLGIYYASEKRSEEALEQFDLALAQYAEEGAPNRRWMATIESRMAQEQQELGNLDEAERRLKSALELREGVYGKRHPYLATTLRRLGRLYVESARNAEAEPLLERALALGEAAWGSVQHDCACGTRDLLEQVYEALGREKELADLRASARPEDDAPQRDALPEEIAELDAQSAELASRGNFPQAMELATEALELRELRFGPGSLETAAGLSRVAQLLKRQTRYAEAAEVFDARLATLEQAGVEPEALADALMDFNRTTRMIGTYAESEERLLAELALRRQLGQRIREIHVLERLGYFHRTEERYADARRYMHEAIDVWRELAGESGPEIVTLRTALAKMDVDEQRFAEAEELLDDVLRRVRSDRAVENHELIRILTPLKEVYSRSGRADDAARVQQQLTELRGK